MTNDNLPLEHRLDRIEHNAQAYARMLTEAVEAAFGDGVICARCGATLATFADVCSADLAQECPGFEAIEEVRQREGM